MLLECQAAPSVQDGLSLQLPETLGHLRWSMAVHLGYLSSPLRSKLGNEQNFEVVSGHLAGQLAFALGLRENFEVSATLDGDVSQSGDASADIGLDLPMTSSGGVGDLSLGARYRFLRSEDERLTMALSTAIDLPTGSQSAFTGDGSLGGRASLLASYQVQRVTLAAQAGAAYRPENQYALLSVGSELFARVGVHTAIGERVRLMLELDTRSDLHEDRIFTTSGSPTEALLGAKVAIYDGLYVGGIIGVGIMNASGEPDTRALASLAWLAPRATEEALAAVPLVPEPETPKTLQVESEAPPVQLASQPSEVVAVTPPAPPVATEPVASEPAIQQEPEVAPLRTLNIGQAQAAMPDGMIFDSGVAELNSATNDSLAQLALFMHDHPEVALIEIRGHASAEGDARGNQRLSRARARKVRSYLLSRKVSPKRLRVKALGSSEPLSGSDADQRQKNRRVEIRVITIN